MKVYKKGDIIASEGTVSNEFYFLIEGKVGAFKDDKKISDYSRKGTIFGELAAILKRPRSLTLVALEDTKILAFDRGYQELIIKHPEFAKKILINLAERVSATTDKLWNIKVIINESFHEQNK
ncbi:MAG: cyclic nucleotide-binding domain-containing protein [Ignavibacteria bacterium]